MNQRHASQPVNLGKLKVNTGFLPVYYKPKSPPIFIL